MTTKTRTIRFNKYYVTDGTTKARCSYSLDNRCDGRKCVTIYGKDYEHRGNVGAIFPDEVQNNTDSQTDYFEKDRVVLFEDHPHYAAARKRAEANEAAWDAKYAN